MRTNPDNLDLFAGLPPVNKRAASPQKPTERLLPCCPRCKSIDHKAIRKSDSDFRVCQMCGLQFVESEMRLVDALTLEWADGTKEG